MTRSNAREIAVQLIFSLGFGNLSAQEVLDSQLTPERFAELAEENALYAQFPNEKQQQYIRDLVQGVFSHGPELDDYISRYAVGWSFARIPRMAAAIMRTAMYEVLYVPDVPNAAAINEAVEIAKRYETQEVVSFVNGILGSFVRAEFADTPPKPEKADDSQPKAEDRPWRSWGWIPATTPPPPPCSTGRGAATPGGCSPSAPESWGCGRATPCFST